MRRPTHSTTSIAQVALDLAAVTAYWISGGISERESSGTEVQVLMSVANRGWKK